MLEKSDTEIVQEWLKLSLANGKKYGLNSKELAARCGVSVQAVNGWLSTGRITKKNLEIASTYFGHRPSFVVSSLVAREEPAIVWPFRKVTIDEVRALKPRQIQRLDSMIRDRLDEWAEDAEAALGGKRKAA